MAGSSVAIVSIKPAAMLRPDHAKRGSHRVAKGHAGHVVGVMSRRRPPKSNGPKCNGQSRAHPANSLGERSEVRLCFVVRSTRQPGADMAINPSSQNEQPEVAWRGFAPGNWQKQVDVRDFIQRNYTPLRRRRRLPAGPDRAHHRPVANAAAAARRGTREGHPRRLAGAVEHPRARAGLHRQGQRDHRRPADRRAAQARDHAVRRLARGRGEPRVLRLQAGRAGRRDLHQVPQDPQRRRLRRLHGGHQAPRAHPGS